MVSSDIKVLFNAIKYYNFDLHIPIRNVNEILKLVSTTQSIPDLFKTNSWFNQTTPEILKYVTIQKLIEIVDAYSDAPNNGHIEYINTCINIKAYLLTIK